MNDILNTGTDASAAPLTQAGQIVAKLSDFHEQAVEHGIWPFTFRSLEATALNIRDCFQSVADNQLAHACAFAGAALANYHNAESYDLSKLDDVSEGKGSDWIGEMRFLIESLNLRDWEDAVLRMRCLCSELNKFEKFSDLINPLEGHG